VNELLVVVSKEIPWYWAIITFISGLSSGVVVMGLCAFGNYKRGFREGFDTGKVFRR